MKEVSSKNGASGGDDSNVDTSHGAESNEEESSPTADAIPEVVSARFVTEILLLLILAFKFNFGNGKVLPCDIVVEVYSVFCWPSCCISLP